uniref:Ectonucleoside triphosphate diphosphohydrolase 3 isoform X2 n=1 Tax=Geotrypetes seraphini TaxID=260995 RepID=A0A6P8P9Y0_GEOSA|nr:ectonucleoside triphosphate diphosphohydrolase 3 isoform X2 [Geotrypetes seraphini]
MPGFYTVPCGSKMPSKTPVIIALVFLLSVAVIITIVFVQIHKKEVLSPGLKYGVVIDAGSSRTTVYVYQWPSEKENNTGMVNQTFKCNVKGSGISSYGNNPQGAAKSIEDCIEKVKEKIPSHQQNSTPVYLGATAGMRLLRSQNEKAANEVLSGIHSYFRNQPFDFRGAQIITGQEEGVYGWITVNYLMGNFLEKNIWRAWARPHGAETTGALDLGGASTQISFIPEKSGQSFKSTVLVTLYGYQYNVYTHSYQCYGRDEAEKKFLALLVQNSPDKSSAENPCYPQNYEVQFTTKHLLSSQCTESLSKADFNPEQTVTIWGTGDPALCRQMVAMLFNFTACDDRDDCSFNAVYQPKVKGKFSAFSGFYYTASALNLTGYFSLETFNFSVWSFCLQNWNKLPLILSKFEETYARSYCFSANYIYYLLVQGYKFNAETWPQIQFQKEVGNSSIAWTLGYMLNLTNMIPAEAELIQFPMSRSIFAGLLFLFTALCVLCLIFLVISLIRAC